MSQLELLAHAQDEQAVFVCRQRNYHLQTSAAKQISTKFPLANKLLSAVACKGSFWSIETSTTPNSLASLGLCEDAQVPKMPKRLLLQPSGPSEMLPINSAPDLAGRKNIAHGVHKLSTEKWILPGLVDLRSTCRQCLHVRCCSPRRQKASGNASQQTHKETTRCAAYPASCRYHSCDSPPLQSNDRFIRCLERSWRPRHPSLRCARRPR